jgi:hypothetical protein
MSVPSFSKAVSILVCAVAVTAAIAGDAASQGLAARPP